MAQSGFKCEFVKKPISGLQTECPICLLILREPYQVICCGKSFCHSCIDSVKTANKPCPHCNTTNFNDFPNKGHQQFLYQLEVRCTNQNEGCEWTGELRELDNHLNLDSQPDNQLKGCVFVMVKCTHCSKSHQRQHINYHQTEVCPKRPFTCEHCKVYKSTFEDVTTNHWPVCGCYPVECSNKCGAVLQQQNLESHVAKDCPLRVIECDFHYAGCEVKLPRKDMGEHLCVELVTHTSMMAASYQQQITSQQQKIATQQNEIATCKQQQNQDRERLEKENEVKSKQITELVKEKQELKERLAELEKEQKEDHTLITVLQAKCNFLPVDIIMNNFEQHMESNEPWYSPPFYTHHRGYKLCLQCKKFEDIYFAFYVCLIQGEFDNELKWPLKGEVIIQLLSQDGSNEHLEKPIPLTAPHVNSTVAERETSPRANRYTVTTLITINKCRQHHTDIGGNLYFKIVSFKYLTM